MPNVEHTREILQEVREISVEVEKIFDEIHSVRNLFRSLAQGVEFESQMRKASTLEERVWMLGAQLFEDAHPNQSGRFRWPRAYCCEVIVAASSLSEITLRANEEFTTGTRFLQKDRQALIQRFLGATKSAHALWELILVPS